MRRFLDFLRAPIGLGLGLGLPFRNVTVESEYYDPGDALLLESGDYFLLETGDKLLLEPQ